MDKLLLFTLICIINKIISRFQNHKAFHFSSQNSYFFFNCSVLNSLFSPIIFVLIFSNSDHFREIVTQKIWRIWWNFHPAAPQCYLPAYICVSFDETKQGGRWECECVEKEEKANTQRGFALCDIWRLNHHRPILSHKCLTSDSFWNLLWLI